MTKFNFKFYLGIRNDKLGERAPKSTGTAIGTDSDLTPVEQGDCCLDVVPVEAIDDDSKAATLVCRNGFKRLDFVQLQLCNMAFSTLL